MEKLTRKKMLLGIIVPNIVSLIIIGWTMLGYTNSEGGNVFIYSEFIIVPLIMGLLSSYYWCDLEFKNKSYLTGALLNGLVAIVSSAIFFREGVVCLLMVSPLIFILIIIGTFIGKAIFKRKNNTLNLSVFGVLLILLAVDIFSPHEYSNKVSDKMIINAPVDVVWKYVVEYEPIKEKPDYWLFRAGMPGPMQSTVDGHYKGAGRKCIFSNGYVFDETMTVYEPNKDLTFAITNQPRDPEIMGHIDILRGQFLLTDNGDGTTTLTGNSWYKLYVFPTWYFDLWAKSVTRNVHLCVMDHIKKLSEKVN